MRNVYASRDDHQTAEDGELKQKHPNEVAEKVAEFIKGLEVFKYLGWLLDPSENNSPAVLHNIRKLRQVWERHVKLLQREGTYPSVSETFYHALLQLVLLFGAEMWVLLAPCKHKQFYITQFHSGNTLLYP